MTIREMPDIPSVLKVKMHCMEQGRIISEIYMFIFQSKFDNPPHRDHITEKSGTSRKNQWDFQISKVGSLDFLDLKVNGSPGGQGIIPVLPGNNCCPTVSQTSQ